MPSRTNSGAMRSSTARRVSATRRRRAGVRRRRRSRRSGKVIDGEATAPSSPVTAAIVVLGRIWAPRRRSPESAGSGSRRSEAVGGERSRCSSVTSGRPSTTRSAWVKSLKRVICWARRPRPCRRPWRRWRRGRSPRGRRSGVGSTPRSAQARQVDVGRRLADATDEVGTHERAEVHVRGRAGRGGGRASRGSTTTPRRCGTRPRELVDELDHAGQRGQLVAAGAVLRGVDLVEGAWSKPVTPAASQTASHHVSSSSPLVPMMVAHASTEQVVAVLGERRPRPTRRSPTRCRGSARRSRRRPPRASSPRRGPVDEGGDEAVDGVVGGLDVDRQAVRRGPWRR